VAAGSGKRFGETGGPPKQYRLLGGIPLLEWSLSAFLTHPGIDRTIVVLPQSDLYSLPDWLAKLDVTGVAGGEMRGDSVRNGIAAANPRKTDLVLIHDGARPLVSRTLIDRVIAGAHGAAVIPGLPVTDTVKEVGDEGWVLSTLDRSRYWCVQTPQAFPLAVLREVHDRAAAEGVRETDDAALFERYGLPVRVIEGEATNIKVTTQIDLHLAELLARRLPAE
jgi:2-C-methyl-D-erythritol 4-phosphate cytidylyltransferase